MNQYFIKYLLVIIIYCTKNSLELHCLQCTSPIQLMNDHWDHSCLNGTLKPRPCPKSSKMSSVDYKQCNSAVFIISPQQNGSLFIHRGCTRAMFVQQDCDPPIISIDTTTSFYCVRSCMGDGCNRHQIKEIFPLSSSLSQISSDKYLSIIGSLLVIVHGSFPI